MLDTFQTMFEVVEPKPSRWDENRRGGRPAPKL